jgi:hypothetical protein
MEAGPPRSVALDHFSTPNGKVGLHLADSESQTFRVTHALNGILNMGFA